MFLNILRLTLLLLTPLWLSLTVEMLDLRVSLPETLLQWARKEKSANPADLPMPGWREAVYLAANPDVAFAVKSGQVRNGYDHYVHFGRSEGRPGAPGAASAAATIPTPPKPAPHPPPSTHPSPVQSAPDPVPAGRAPPAPPPSAPMPAPAPEHVAQDNPPKEAVRPPPAVASPPSPVSAAPKPQAKPALAPTPAAAPLLVSHMRMANNGAAVRIVLDLNGPPRFTPLAQRTANRLEVMLSGTAWKAAATGTFASASLTYRVETVGGVSHLIIGGQRSIAAKAIFALPPEGERGHRLVIDVAAPAKEPPAPPRKRT